MKKLKFSLLMVLGVSGFAIAAEQTDAEKKSLCVYQGQTYGVGSPISVGGKDLICVRKNGDMRWLPEREAQAYL